MPPKTIKSNNLGKIIKKRRNELNLTIEEAALKAGLGTKTWSRYESGESIRKDKVRGICKALNWKTIPDEDNIDINDEIDFNEYRKSKTWSPYLEKYYGKYAALSFEIGSEILLNEIDDDLSELSKMPKGAHIGEIQSSFISPLMPKQFLVRYDYEFMFAMRQTLIRYRENAPNANNFIAHSVLDELVLYLIQEESIPFIEETEGNKYSNTEDEYTGYREWVFEIFDDMDIVIYLYSDIYFLLPDDTYHFDNWFENRFYIKKDEIKEEKNK